MTSRAEIDRRYAAIRAAAEADGLDAVIVSGNEYTGFEGPIRYVSGFRILHRYAYVLIPLDGEPTMIERSSFTDAVGSLLFEFDTDSGSITDYLTDRGVQWDAMEHVLDAVAADEVDAENMHIERGSPLLRERRTSRDQFGVAFEYSDDRYRPDVVAFSIVNARTIDVRA